MDVTKRKTDKELRAILVEKKQYPFPGKKKKPNGKISLFKVSERK